MKNNTRAQKPRAKGGAVEVVRTVVEALLIAIVFRTLLFQPFTIPSGSMEPTLLIGDYLFVSKFTYGYSRYSLPFGPPVFSGRIFGSDPNRGDIVVFRHGDQDFIKRVIGLPGDRIQVTRGTLLINGTPVTRERAADFVGRDPCPQQYRPWPPSESSAATIRVVHVKQWRETLPNGVSFHTLECSLNEGLPDNTGVYAVPPGHFFMMGDNRENSEDSRFPDVGYVPSENLIGRAQIIFFSIEGDRAAWQIWTWPWAARWNRLFTWVR